MLLVLPCTRWAAGLWDRKPPKLKVVILCSVVKKKELLEIGKQFDQHGTSQANIPTEGECRQMSVEQLFAGQGILKLLYDVHANLLVRP